MRVKPLFHLFLIVQLIFSSSAKYKTSSLRNETKAIKVLAAAFPPFTYFDKDRGFIDGTDLLLLRTISKRLNYRLILDKSNDIYGISRDKIE